MREGATSGLVRYLFGDDLSGSLTKEHFVKLQSDLIDDVLEMEEELLTEMGDTSLNNTSSSGGPGTNATLSGQKKSRKNSTGSSNDNNDNRRRFSRSSSVSSVCSSGSSVDSDFFDFVQVLWPILKVGQLC